MNHASYKPYSTTSQNCSSQFFRQFIPKKTTGYPDIFNLTLSVTIIFFRDVTIKIVSLNQPPVAQCIQLVVHQGSLACLGITEETVLED